MKRQAPTGYPLDSPNTAAQHVRVTEYFQLDCVRCSRTLRVRLEYIGHEIACNHCNQTFLASSRDPRVLQFLVQQRTTGSEPDPVQENLRAQELADLKSRIEKHQLELAATRA